MTDEKYFTLLIDLTVLFIVGLLIWGIIFIQFSYTEKQEEKLNDYFEKHMPVGHRDVSSSTHSQFMYVNKHPVRAIGIWIIFSAFVLTVKKLNKMKNTVIYSAIGAFLFFFFLACQYGLLVMQILEEDEKEEIPELPSLEHIKNEWKQHNKQVD